MAEALKCPSCGAEVLGPGARPTDQDPAVLNIVQLADGRMRIVMDLVLEREAALKVLSALQVAD